MKHSHKVSRRFFWLSASASVLLCGAIALSGFRKFGLTWYRTDDVKGGEWQMTLGFSGGCAFGARWECSHPMPPVQTGPRTYFQQIGGHKPQFKPLFLPSQIRDWGEYIVIFPMWIPLAVLILMTAILWRIQRRVPPGHCPRCRYNLTGNTTGVCPECGLSIQHKAT